MCIAIYQPEDCECPLNEETFHYAAKNNPDGMGIAYFHDGKLKVYKTLNNLDGLKDRYELALESNRPVILHFRVKTHGSISIENCHPFWSTKHKVVMAHNGTIPFLSDKKKINDTKRFIEEIIEHLPEGFLDNPAILELIANSIGYSKLVFLDNRGKGYIVNKEKGYWDKGIWFSNTSYLPPVPKKEEKKKKTKSHTKNRRYVSSLNMAEDMCYIGYKPVCIACLPDPEGLVGKDVRSIRGTGGRPLYVDPYKPLETCCEYCGYKQGSYSTPEIVAILNNLEVAEGDN